MIRGGLGDSGQRQSQDCAFEAAKINGTPIRVSYFLVIMFFYQIVGAYQQHAPVWWFPILYAVGTQFLLLATILCHEFGHGLMAKYLGGTIAQILLWPFGGICFSTRPSNILDGRQKIKNELKIVAAGPSTHFLQAPFWVFVLLLQLHFYEVPAEVVSPNDLWYLLIPFSAPPPVPFAYLPGLISQLFWMLACWAVTTNVYLFLFNVFFPMYPMDSAQILVCSLQLCSFSAQFAAKALISVSVPMSVLLLLYAWTNRSQGMMPAITGYLACMCLVEAYNIWKLYKARQLHTHRLFELARSATGRCGSAGGWDKWWLRRAGNADREHWSGAWNAGDGGERLYIVSWLSCFYRFNPGVCASCCSESDTPPNTGGFAALAQRDRAAFLSRVEQNQQQRNMTVRQLNEVREQQGSGGGGVVGQAANSGRRYVQAEPRWSKTGPDPPV
eukprot:g7889.t1